MYKSHLITSRSIFICFDDGKAIIDTTNPKYEQIRNALRQNPNSEMIKVLCNRDLAVNGRKKSMFTLKNGTWFFKNEALPQAIGKMIAEFEMQQIPCDAIIHFWNRLKMNPTESSRNELLTFCLKHRVCITDDGMLVLYKYVRDDYMDCHSGTFDNHPGMKHSMPRDKVDHNRNNNCSSGFHVCAWGYLSWGSSKRTVEVLVDPVNVCSIPADCNCRKMRCCAYEVIREINECGEPIPIELPYSSKERSKKPEPEEKPEVEDEIPVAVITKQKREKENPRQKSVYDMVRLSRCSKGRVLIPASFLHKLRKAMVVYVRVEGKTIIIGNKKTDMSYKIDDHYNIRIAKSILEQAGLGKVNNFRLEFNEKELVLKGGR